MRPILKVYIALVGVSALLLLGHDLSVLVSWPHPWSLGVTIALIVLTALSDQLQFEVRRGWYTNASAVAHISSVFLLPPALAMTIAALGVLVRTVRYPLPAFKTVFNVASISLAVGVAGHVASNFGGPDRVGVDGEWSDPLVALLVSATYCALSAPLVAVAVAFHRRCSVWEVTRGNLAVQTVGEMGLGLIGAMLAAMLNSAPNWAPMLLVPAMLLYVAKQSIDRADRRSRNMAVTSAVGRAVAGTLDPERAFHAIAEPAVLDGLKIDGLALLPLGEPLFRPHMSSDLDLPSLRAVLLEQLTIQPRPIDLHATRGRTLPDWFPKDLHDLPITAAAIPFGTGSGRPVGGLIAWREVRAGRRDFFDKEEMLVLKTLADYAAVALETARLSEETARLHHEAGQAEARREMEALRKVASLKDEFLGQVSHELRTPLTIIHGYSELLVDGMLSDPDLVRQSAGEIHSSSALMLRLVDDLLDTSRLDSGRITLEKKPIDLTCWLGRVTAGFGQANPSHTVSVELPHAVPPVIADPNRLSQVMNNLLSNAARYSTPGTEIRVRATHPTSHDCVEIEVIDRGSGIPAEDRERIFEKFYRGKHGATLAVRGTGLGLAVARQLVEAHGGTIGVRSAVGEGSTFWLRLPIDRGAALTNRAQAA